MQVAIKNDIKKYYDLWFGINAIYEKWAKVHGITSNTLFVFWMLYEYNETCTQHLISQKLLLPKQTINAILQTIQKNGYIKMVSDEKDRRNKVIVLTDHGIKYVEQIMHELYSFEETAFSNMDAVQRKNMLEGSEDLLKNLLLSFESIEKRVKPNKAEDDI